MKHRHLNSGNWSVATVDSVLERGDLKDWRELFAAVRKSSEVAELVLRAAAEHDLGGASILAKGLVKRLKAEQEGSFKTHHEEFGQHEGGKK